MSGRFLVTLAITLCAIGLFPTSVTAQTPEEEVRAVIDRLFDGMREGDSTAVRSVFYDEAQLTSVATRDGRPVLFKGSVDRFVEAVGTPHEDVWDERIWNTEIRIDGNLATAWMNYTFFLGDRLSHCGVNAFQLFRGTDGWKIISIADTRYQEGCTGPPDGDR